MPPQTDIARALAHAIDGALWARDVLDVDLDDWQADVVREPGDQLLCVTRQGGKSNTVGIKALHHLLHVPASLRPARARINRKSCSENCSVSTIAAPGLREP